MKVYFSSKLCNQRGSIHFLGFILKYVQKCPSKTGNIGLCKDVPPIVSFKLQTRLSFASKLDMRTSTDVSSTLSISSPIPPVPSTRDGSSRLSFSITPASSVSERILD